MQLRSRGTKELIDLADGMTIGRMADCDIQLQDGSISRHHASIEGTGGMLFLVDNGSSNGCFRNGEKTKRCEIRVGDLLTLGAVAFDVVGEPKRRMDGPSAAGASGASASSLVGASSPSPASSSSSSPPASQSPASSRPASSRPASSASAQADAEAAAPSRSAEAAAERARLRHEIAGNHRSSGLGDLGQQPFGIKVLAGLLGLAVMYGVIVGIRFLAASL